jgi:hypothetical protein
MERILTPGKEKDTMILERTMPRTAKVDIISVLLLAAIAAIAAVVPACGAPPVEDLDAADEAHLSEKADALLASQKHRKGCEVVRCMDGFSCEEQDGHAVCVANPSPPQRSCQTDSDCSLAANYCGGCNCLAVGPGQSVPKCEGDVVACVQWPCHGYAAYCYDGTCVASQGALQ